MYRVRDLTETAWSLDVESFARNVGPIVLVQQPPPEARVALVRAAPPKYTVPLPTLNENSLPALGKFEDLIVATLPARLPDGTLQLVIGRNAGNDLVVPDPAVSGRHAALRWDGKKAILVDLGSANGTFINLKKMGTQATLNNGDQLSFGLSTFAYLTAAAFHAKLRAWKPRPR